MCLNAVSPAVLVLLQLRTSRCGLVLLLDGGCRDGCGDGGGGGDTNVAKQRGFCAAHSLAPKYTFATRI